MIIMNDIYKETMRDLYDVYTKMRKIRSDLSCPTFEDSEFRKLVAISEEFYILIDEICERMDIDNELNPKVNKFKWFVKYYGYEKTSPYNWNTETDHQGISVKMTHTKISNHNEVVKIGWSDEMKDVLIAVYDAETGERTLIAWSNIDYNTDYHKA